MGIFTVGIGNVSVGCVGHHTCHGLYLHMRPTTEQKQKLTKIDKNFNFFLISLRII